MMLLWLGLRSTSCPGFWVGWRGGANNVQVTSHTEVMLLWTCLRSASCPGSWVRWRGELITFKLPRILKWCFFGLVLGLYVMCWVFGGVEGGLCILKWCYAGLVLGLRLVLGFGVGWGSNIQGAAKTLWMSIRSHMAIRFYKHKRRIY